MHKFLALRVRAAGHPRTRNSYYVNIQTDGPITTDLWQHRLYFRRDDGGWEDIYVRSVLTQTVLALLAANAKVADADSVRCVRAHQRRRGVL